MQSLEEEETACLFRVKRQQLIINADDYGYEDSIDEGIVELVKAGNISSVSVIVNGKNIVKAVRMIKQLFEESPNIVARCSVGLHFNLTEGKPASQSILEGTLVEEGQFLGKSRLYQIIEKGQGFRDDQIAAEFKEQVKLFISYFKRRPSHVDGHNHIHILPRIAKVISNLMAEHGIYRTRLLNQDLQDIKISLNHFFLTNTNIAKHIYHQCKIISADKFVGLEDFGNISAQRIRKTKEDLLKSQSNYKSIELMCHPGYPSIDGIPWVSSLDRLKEKKALQSADFFNLIQEYKGLSSYLDLSPQTNFKVSRLLIYSKMDTGTGNHTTTLRLKRIFQQIGYEVYLWSVQEEVNTNLEVLDLQKFLISYGISLILGINVSRSAQIIYEATHNVKKIRMAVPYILVIAGTDANITFKDAEKLQNLRSALGYCRCIVSLSCDMTKITEQALNKLNIQKDIFTIVQSSCLGHLYSFINDPNATNTVSPDAQLIFERPFILFPTSFRRVKCVHHLFDQLNELIKTSEIDVYIAGPILDRKYYQQCKDKFGLIKYLGVLQRGIYAQYLKKASVIINTSESEGMSCSILQAFEFKVPVIVRNNAGNRQLVQHLYNGLIYDNPQEFTDLYLQIITDEKLRQTLILNSMVIFQSKYNVQSEIHLYKTMLKRKLDDRIFTLQLNNERLRIFNHENIHPTSQVNNQLFLQIQPHIKDKATILDIGCGTGIFSLMYILKSNARDLSIYVSDITSQIASYALFNYRQSSLWDRISSITCIKSNLFDSIDKSVRFDVMLFNPPQTPFRINGNRLDKNGGLDGTKFYGPTLQYFAKSSISKLYMLHSYMGWPARFKQLLQQNNLEIQWKSTPGIHKILKSDYDLMQPNLSDYILQHLSLGRAQIELQDSVFHVPAQIYCIVRK